VSERVWPRPALRPRSLWLGAVLAQWCTVNVGYFAVLAVLSLYLVDTLRLPPDQAGLLLLLSSLPYRLARVFLVPLLERVSPRVTMVASLGASCVGCLGLALTQAVPAVAGLLVLTGAGYGTNALAVKTLAAHAKSQGPSPLMRYASLSTGVNLAAAVGPLVGNALFLHRGAGAVFLLAAATYGLAAVIAAGMPDVPSDTVPPRRWLTGLRASLRTAAVRRSVVFTVLGFFLYTQLYATLPLFAHTTLGAPALIGSFFGLNAVLVLVGQLPLSHLTERWSLSTTRVIQAAFAAFAGGFAVLSAWPHWTVVYAAVALWTLGEMLLMPVLDTIVAEGVPPEDRVMAFALTGGAAGVGAGLGNMAGVTLAGWLLKAGTPHHLYALLAAIAAAAACGALPVGGRDGGLDAG
jgi:MFS family permease